MKKLIIILPIFLVVCCVQNNNRPVYVDFTHSKELDDFEISSDSTICYFPEQLFTDTILCYITPSGQIIDPKYFEKEMQIRIYGGSMEELRDTFKIETDSFDFKMTSYMLYKMQEPVLSDRFLGKDTYRIIALRSFHKPVIIKIEKHRGKISIISKELNRRITYPFFVLAPYIRFKPPQIKGICQKIDNEKQYEIAKREHDSLRNVLNNSNYYLTLNDKKEIPFSVWDSLEVLVDSAKFWKTKPELYLNNIQIDGSMWYIEGHFKSGYQIKRIPSPHFSKSKYPHGYDKNDCYAQIFRFFFENAKMDEEFY